MTEPRGWHWRGYLPHFDGGEVPQAVTFRLADALPGPVLEQMRMNATRLPVAAQANAVQQQIDRELDRGGGSAYLREPAVADIVRDALQWGDGQRYALHAWVVMPNHVHTLFTPLVGRALSAILHSWKSYTAHEANRLLGRQGPFWQEDYYDRFVRDVVHFHRAVSYIENNPVSAGLCDSPAAWPWSSACLREVEGH